MSQSQALEIAPVDNYMPDQNGTRFLDPDQDFYAVLDEVAAEKESTEAAGLERIRDVVDAGDRDANVAKVDPFAEQSSEEVANDGTEIAPDDTGGEDEGESDTTGDVDPQDAMLVALGQQGGTEQVAGRQATGMTGAVGSGAGESGAAETAISLSAAPAGQQFEQTAASASAEAVEDQLSLSGTNAESEEDETIATAKPDTSLQESAKSDDEGAVESRNGDIASQLKNNMKQAIEQTDDNSGNALESSTFSTDEQSTKERSGSNLPGQSQGNNADISSLGAGQVEKSTSVNSVLGLDEARGPSASDMAENVDRIVKAARATVNRGSARIQIRLDPPELGTLRIDMKHDASGLTLELQTGNARTQQLLQRHIGQLQQMLEASGVHANQINVELRSELQDGQLRDQDQAQGDFAGQTSDENTTGEEGQGQEYQSDRYAAGIEYETNDVQDEAAEPVLAGSSAKGWRELEFSTLDIVV